MRQASHTQPFSLFSPQFSAYWVALLLLGVYLLSTGGQPFISDGEVMRITATRIAEEHTVTLPGDAAVYPQVVRRADGVLFSKYGLGQPLLAAPLHWFGRYVVGRWLAAPDRAFYVGQFTAVLLPAIVTALTGGVLCAWAARLYHSTRMGVALALLWGLGTLAWPYSRFFFSEPLFTACLLAAACAIYTRHPLVAGLAFGYAVLTRTIGAALLPAFVVYLALAPSPSPNGRGAARSAGVRVRQILWFLPGTLPAMLLWLAYNWVRFRSLADHGYASEGFTGNLWDGLYGLLLSPGKSLFLYVPLLLALPFAVWPFARRCKAEALFIGMVTVIMLLTSATWWIWWGGTDWGPRFLVPLLPFLVLPLGTLLEQRAWRLIIGLVLLPLSLFVNALGILVDFNTYINQIAGNDLSRAAIYLFQPAYSPIVAHLQRLDFGNVPIVSFALGSPQIGFSQPAATLISWSFVVLTCGALAGLLFALGTRELRNKGAEEQGNS
jgi:hypothetical protein